MTVCNLSPNDALGRCLGQGGSWNRLLPLAGWTLAACLTLTANAPSWGAEVDDYQWFEQNIRPVLAERCYACHSRQAADQGKLKGGLLLDSREGIRRGGESGPAVVPGDPEAGTLLPALRHEDFEMPPDGRLPQTVVASFERWVRRGAPDPREGPSDLDSEVVSGRETAAGPPTPEAEATARNHWAYRPIPKLVETLATLPTFSQATRAAADSPSRVTDLSARTVVDAFILNQLQAHGIVPAPAADRRTLIRRLRFDLHGLPPTDADVEAFVRDRRPDAYERLVDRLLASPRFGERWGRHWLDLVRYAESLTLRGFVWPNAWRYRDYVINAFNDDRPLDEFFIEQIAGDLMPAADLHERQRRIIATTFLTMGNNNLEDQDKSKLEMDVIDEQLQVISTAMLAQTVTCARCHDHKFDPIPTADYYALAGILRNVQTLNHANVSQWIEVDLPLDSQREAVWASRQQRIKTLTEQVHELKRQIQQTATSPALSSGGEKRPTGVDKKHLEQEKKQLEAELKRLRSDMAARPRAMSVLERSPITDCPIHIRGNVHRHGAVVPRGFLRIVGNLGIDVPDGESGRLQLGRWIASPENPLTARVWANRTWHWLFGSGICRTVDNFGMRGELPSHPALLDYLARDLSEHRWSTKYLVRELVMTDAYRRSTESSAGGRQLDPENRLWWRARQKRLDAESLADAMMMASGELDLAVGGPGIESNLANDYGYRRDSRRRAVYWPVLRNSLPRLFEAFDFADPSLVVGRRNVSSVPTQALFMLNDPFVLARAERTADWILQRDGLTDFQRFQLAYRCLLGREPSDRQWRIAREFLEDRQTDRKTAWTKLVQSLFASVDFRYVQ